MTTCLRGPAKARGPDVDGVGVLGRPCAAATCDRSVSSSASGWLRGREPVTGVVGLQVRSRAAAAAAAEADAAEWRLLLLREGAGGLWRAVARGTRGLPGFACVPTCAHMPYPVCLRGCNCPRTCGTASPLPTRRRLHTAPRLPAVYRMSLWRVHSHVVNASGESWKTGNMDFTGGRGRGLGVGVGGWGLGVEGWAVAVGSPKCELSCGVVAGYWRVGAGGSCGTPGSGRGFGGCGNIGVEASSPEEGDWRTGGSRGGGREKQGQWGGRLVPCGRCWRGDWAVRPHVQYCMLN